MKKLVQASIIRFLAALSGLYGVCCGASICLTEHLQKSSDLAELRNIRTEWVDGVLKLHASQAERYAWAVIKAPDGGWDLGACATVDAEVKNSGENPVGVMLWLVGNHGWDAVSDVATLAPHEIRTLSCNLRASFPDGTPRLNPFDVKQVQIILAEPVFGSTKSNHQDKTQDRLNARITKPVSVEIRSINAHGKAPDWIRPVGRVNLPSVENSPPTPGKRVRYRLPGDEDTGIYSVLNLPEDWKQGGKYPILVEYPGNIFIVPSCYSTGLPDQCVIGYGITKGKGAICVGVPFVDRITGSIAEDGWGNPDDTKEYVIKMVDMICDYFGGDRDNVVLTGFSRGAIACGYIGLRDENIASRWKGFHACQHYDGDGWRGATMTGALERAARFKGRGVFQTDNSPKTFQPVMNMMNTDVTWAQSGLGSHATAMFLDDRPSTQQLREWFWRLVGKE